MVSTYLFRITEQLPYIQIMTHTHLHVAPGKTARTFLSESGEQLIPPADWAFLPAGDAAITRSVKSKGPTWVVQIKKGRRYISKGIWALETSILDSVKEIEAKRKTPSNQKKR